MVKFRPDFGRGSLQQPRASSSVHIPAFNYALPRAWCTSKERSSKVGDNCQIQFILLECRPFLPSHMREKSDDVRWRAREAQGYRENEPSNPRNRLCSVPLRHTCEIWCVELFYTRLCTSYKVSMTANAHSTRARICDS